MDSKVKQRADARAQEQQYCAQSYQPLPVVLARGEGIFVYDTEGRRYYDFLSAYSAVSQGHCHPDIVAALKAQAEQLTLTSRAFYNDVLGPFAAYITDYFGYDQVLPMSTGVEAVESAIKIARKWGYEKKKVPAHKAKIIACRNNFHGRTTTVVSFSTNPVAQKHFGPFMPGFELIPFDDLGALEAALQDTSVVAFLVEPIQGEAGVMVPAENYMKEAKALCQRHNVLLIADEIQTGMGRTGADLALCGECSCEGACERQSNYVAADMLLLGKALSGGVYPVSAVLANKEVMDVITPGTHGSTYGGNPLACRVARAALEVMRKEKLPQRARKLGKYFRDRLQKLSQENNFIAEVRGRGLLNSIDIRSDLPEDTAWRFCLALRDNGLLARPTHGHIIRMAPPLVITQEELAAGCDIIARTASAFAT